VTVPTTIAEWRAVQEQLDQASTRAIYQHTQGQITRAAMDAVLELNARLWTRAQNEIAGLQVRPVYQEDNVSPTVF